MSEDYNHELRARALAVPEVALRQAVDRLLEQCGKEDTHAIPGLSRAQMLYTSEIYALLGLRAAQSYAALEQAMNQSPKTEEGGDR